MKSIVKDALILFVITLIAGVLLGFVHEITLEPIAVAKENAANNTYREVFPEAATFEADAALTAAAQSCSTEPDIQLFGTNVSVNDALLAKDNNGNIVGFIIRSSAKGYGGAVEVAAGVDLDGTMTGLGFLEINETPGLGMRAKEPDFTNQFVSMTDVDNMQAISGATYTSKAVSGAAQAAMYFFENYTDEWRDK